MTGPLDNVELLALAWCLGMAFLLLVAVIETVANWMDRRAGRDRPGGRIWPS